MKWFRIETSKNQYSYIIQKSKRAEHTSSRNGSILWLDLMGSVNSSIQSRCQTPTNPLNSFCIRREIAWTGIVEQSTTCRGCEADTCQTWIPQGDHTLTYSGFKSFESVSSISFESNSGLKPTESNAFSSAHFAELQFHEVLKFFVHRVFQDVEHFHQFHLNQIQD
jgi:hypothetical protein